MTQQKEDTMIRTVMEIINAGGIENLGEAISILIICTCCKKTAKPDYFTRSSIMDIHLLHH